MFENTRLKFVTLKPGFGVLAPRTPDCPGG
jgi:hypothetical protein